MDPTMKETMNQILVGMKGLKSDMKGLKSDVKGLKSDVKGLKSDVKGLKTDMVDVKNTQKLILSSQELLIDVQKDQTLMLAKLETEVKEVKQIQQDHTLKITNLETEVKEVKQIQQDHNLKITNLETDLKEVKQFQLKSSLKIIGAVQGVQDDLIKVGELVESNYDLLHEHSDMIGDTNLDGVEVDGTSNNNAEQSSVPILENAPSMRGIEDKEREESNISVNEYYGTFTNGQPSRAMESEQTPPSPVGETARFSPLPMQNLINSDEPEKQSPPEEPTEKNSLTMDVAPPPKIQYPPNVPRINNPVVNLGTGSSGDSLTGMKRKRDESEEELEEVDERGVKKRRVE